MQGKQLKYVLTGLRYQYGSLDQRIEDARGNPAPLSQTFSASASGRDDAVWGGTCRHG
jgi:hypothetical protein